MVGAAVGADLREVAHAAQEAQRDARCPAAARRDGVEGTRGDALDRQDSRGAVQDAHEVVVAVVLEVVGDAEAAAQRLGEKAGTRRGADERERLERDRDHARVHAAVEREVDAAVLHRGIDELLDRRGQPVDLVDEQHITRLHLGERAHEVARLGERGAAGDMGARAHLGRDHMRDGGLTEAGWAVQQHMLHRIAAEPRRLERDGEALDEVALAHVVAERPRADLERLRVGIRLALPLLRPRRDDAFLGHGAENTLETERRRRTLR